MTMPVGVIEFVEFGDVVETSWNPPVIFSRDPHQEAGQLRARSEFLKIKALA